MTAYRVLRGLNYRPRRGAPERRAEPGAVVTDLPAKSVPWLKRVGAIEAAPVELEKNGGET